MKHPLYLFTTLPSHLLERLLAHPLLSPDDLAALRAAAQTHAPSVVDHVSNAVSNAVSNRLHAHPYSSYLLAAPLPQETPLDALRFLHLLDVPATPSPRATLWSSGRNDSGQGVRSSPADSNVLLPCFRVPNQPLGNTSPPPPIASVAAGTLHSACLTVLGALLIAGDNSRGQLGQGDLARRHAWTPVLDLKHTRIAQVSCGEAHTLVLTASGALLVTGANSYGQLALPDEKDRLIFQTAIPSNVAMISAGRRHSVALMQDGTVLATGDNSCGQLGGRQGTASSEFRQVGCFGSKVVRIACGNDTTMMLTAENMVLVTGKRKCGLSVIGGLGTSLVTHLSVGERFAIIRTMQQDVAVSINRKGFRVKEELHHINAKGVTAGVAHYAIVCNDGSVLAAGANAFGQVAAGNMGLTVQGGPNARLIRTHQVPLTKVPMPQGYHAVQVAAGAFHTLYLLAPDD